MNEAFFAAVESGDVETLSKLLDEDPELASATDEDGIPAVLVALYHRQLESRYALLQAGAHVGPLEAAALGYVTGLDPAARGADGFTALHLAAFFGGAETVDALLKAGADPDADQENPLRVRPLHAAVASGDARAAWLLLDAGADPNVRQRGGFTPLHAAAHSGDADVVRMLLQHGADATLTTDEGQDARSLATGAAAGVLTP